MIASTRYAGSTGRAQDGEAECPQDWKSLRDRTHLHNGEASTLNKPRCLWSGMPGMATTTHGTYSR